MIEIDEDRLYGLLDEIDAITIGADSPDARDLINNRPVFACGCMIQDLKSISNIVDEIYILMKEKEENEN